jgi:hypothetical protein
VELPDPLITALKFVNGNLYAFSGSATGGMRISIYTGGRTFQEIAYLDDTFPPFQGAVDYLVNRIVWGGKTSTPITSASVFAYGGKSRAMAMGVHNILNSTSVGTAPMATAVHYISQLPAAQPVVAWKSTVSAASVYGVDKPSTSYGTTCFRSEIFRISTGTNITRIRIPIVGGMAANKSFTVQAYLDDGISQSSLWTVNNTTNPGAYYIDIKPLPTWRCNNNFFLEFKNTGTALCVLGLPIIITIETEIQN